MRYADMLWAFAAVVNTHSATDFNVNMFRIKFFKRVKVFLKVQNYMCITC